ncbi:MAG: hypothetical protein GF409_08010 [Candidatus Omnitrophica bacterium]|nr:hypothetical protein [Candidatus Omnitrophota bacterium]
MTRSLTEHARENISRVHELSREYNGKEKSHMEVLLYLVKKHAEEIEELYRASSEKFPVEVGDLLILCHEMLLESGEDPDGIMELCYGRYRRKLRELMERKEA